MHLVLFSFTFFGISDLLYKRAQMLGVNPVTFMIVQATFYNLAAWGVALATNQLHFYPSILLWAPIGGATAFFWSVLLMRSLRIGDASVNVPLFKMSFLGTAFLAIWLLGEALTLAKIVALVLAAGAALMFASQFSSGQGVLRRESLPSLLGAIGFNAIFALVQKIAVADGVPAISYLPFQAIFYLAISSGFALLTGQLDRKVGKGMRFAPVCGILLASAILLLLISLQTTDASVSVPIVQLSFVLTSLLAMALMGEPVNGRKLGGIGLAACSVLAFTFVH